MAHTYLVNLGECQGEPQVFWAGHLEGRIYLATDISSGLRYTTTDVVQELIYINISFHQSRQITL